MNKKKLRKHLERVIELRIERIAELCEENAALRTELAAANATIAQLNDDLYEAAQVADADNETVAALVSQIEDEKVTALRAELAAAKSQIVELNRIIAQWHVQLMESGE